MTSCQWMDIYLEQFDTACPKVLGEIFKKQSRYFLCLQDKWDENPAGATPVLNIYFKFLVVDNKYILTRGATGVNDNFSGAQGSLQLSAVLKSILAGRIIYNIFSNSESCSPPVLMIIHRGAGYNAVALSETSACDRRQPAQQCNATHCTASQWNAIWCTEMQGDAMHKNAMQYYTTILNAKQYNAKW